MLGLTPLFGEPHLGALADSNKLLEADGDTADLHDHGRSGHELLGFGDGFVESKR